jgi:hypothetical protein
VLLGDIYYGPDEFHEIACLFTMGRPRECWWLIVPLGRRTR